MVENGGRVAIHVLAMESWIHVMVKDLDDLTWSEKGRTRGLISLTQRMTGATALQRAARPVLLPHISGTATYSCYTAMTKEFAC